MKHTAYLKSYAFFGFFFILCGLILSACGMSGQPAQIQVPCGNAPMINAINDANLDPDPTTLVLEPNCEIGFISPDNNDGLFGWNALPQITTPITLLGNDSMFTRSESGDQFRFFYVTSQGTLRLEDLILDHGYVAANEGGTGPGGGAVVNDGGVLTLHGVTLISNTGTNGGALYNTGSLIIEADTLFWGNVSKMGGAIFNEGSAGIPISITDTIFEKNIAQTTTWGAGFGGAIYNADTSNSGLLISDSKFKSNSGRAKGGALFSADQTATTQIYNVILENNSAKLDGGAIYLDLGSLIITQSTILYNRAGAVYAAVVSDDESRGGGIYNNNGNLEIDQSIISNNYAEYEGGKIINQAGDVSITGSAILSGTTNRDRNTHQYPSFGGCLSNYGTFSVATSSVAGCKSAYGAGIINHVNATANLSNVTMDFNRAIRDGGHIYNRGNINLVYVTFDNGEAYTGLGGSIFMHGGIAKVKDSIFDIDWNYFNNNCVIDSGSFTAFGNNIDRSGDCPGFNVSEDPGLHYGGGYFILEEGSPALDGASNCNDLNGNPIGIDQRGVNRPQPAAGTCDIGAIEMDFPGPSPPEPRILPRLSAPENLTCREGDHNDYSAVGYLLEGEIAEVVGRNSESTWLVINNPDWEGICWLFRGDLDLEGDLDSTEIFSAPPLIKPKPDGDGDGEPSLTCSGYVGKADCEAAGGYYNITKNPPCTCP